MAKPTLERKQQTRRQLRRILHKVNILGTTYVVLEDGKVTREDGTVIAYGLIQAAVIHSEEWIIAQISRTGILNYAGRAINIAGGAYLGGLGLSWFIDGGEGVENYHNFLSMAAKQPAAAIGMTIQSALIVGEDLRSRIPTFSLNWPDPIEVIEGVVSSILEPLPFVN